MYIFEDSVESEPHILIEAEGNIEELSEPIHQEMGVVFRKTTVCSREA